MCSSVLCKFPRGRAVAQSVTRLAYSHATLAVLSLATGAWVRSLAPAGDNCPFIPWIRIFALIIPSFGGDAKRRSSVYTHAEHRTHYKDPMTIFQKSRHGTPVVHGKHYQISIHSRWVWRCNGDNVSQRGCPSFPKGSNNCNLI